MTTVAPGGTVSEVGAETILTGPALPTGFLSLEEIARPHQVTDRYVTLPDGSDTVRLSYRELMERAASTAARLRKAGLTPGSSVACVLTNDLGSVLTLLGVWMAGGGVVSAPPRSGRGALPGQGIAGVLERMGCEFFVSDEDGTELPLPPGARLLSQGALTERDSERHPIPDLSVPDNALVQFTSGSVGTPKGVVVRPTELAGHLKAVGTALELEQDRDRMVSWLPLYHDMGLVAMFLTGLAARIDIVLSNPTGFAKRPASWLTSLSEERATVTAAPNFAYRLAAAVPYSPDLDLSRMRVSLSGGERLQWESLLDFNRVAEPLGFGWGAIQPSYGLAEGVVGTTTTAVGRGPKLGPNGHVSLGVPLSGVRLKLRTGTEPGPILLGGSSRFAGYQTTEGFEPSTGEWHDTGDAGFVYEGELHVSGRRNEVIALAGRNIFAEDVEAITHGVGDAQMRACAAFRDPGDDTRLALVIEVARQTDADEALALAREVRTSVITLLGTRLTSVRMVRPGTIPRTTSGKVQRARCRDLIGSDAIGSRTLAELV
ncbi:AMP-binding protein [Streptomyces sp. MB22_4]|uniref:AMP-binding protein n=1 Tax=Streptomyces sp. MB22_4 TaxID=3383120 RepID=UPI0039A11FEB